MGFKDDSIFVRVAILLGPYLFRKRAQLRYEHEMNEEGLPYIILLDERISTSFSNL